MELEARILPRSWWRWPCHLLWSWSHRCLALRLRRICLQLFCHGNKIEFSRYYIIHGKVRNCSRNCIDHKICRGKSIRSLEHCPGLVWSTHVLVMFVDIHEDMGSAKGQIGKSYFFVLKQKLRVSGWVGTEKYWKAGWDNGLPMSYSSWLIVTITFCFSGSASATN